MPVWHHNTTLLLSMCLPSKYKSNQAKGDEVIILQEIKCTVVPKWSNETSGQATFLHVHVFFILDTLGTNK